MTQTLSPSPRFDKLKRVLEELFQFDQADLDFGIYRIMNAKRGELTRFLDDDLLPQVQTELGKLAGGNRAEIEKELADTLKNATSLGVPDPEGLPKVKELRAKLGVTTDLSAVEADIYNDLAGFFRRYYQNGDFLSLRRYKKDVYAIPYEGEEVKLHWANADQYYVKSSETFRDYTFHLPPKNGTDSASGTGEGERRVHFKLADADTDANNNKAETGKERRFILADPPLLEEDGELSVRFTYRASGEKQTKLNADAASTILAQEGFDSWLSALRDPRPTEKNPKRTLLEKQLADYTAKNSFDYFIHKDLRGFLRRELDFFIKNEVLQLDDLETEGETRALAQLARVKAMRGVAHKIIEMLAQLENFQKKLWLKKKFVVSTDYCVTLDKLIENAPELLGEVAGNEAQRREWVRLFAIDELTGDALGTTPGYKVPGVAGSEPLTRAFLEANPFLVLDTQFYGAAFKDKLLASFDDLDAQTDGLLVKSENFGALNLLQARYKEQVKCIYIDPPYNTGGGDFAYKDDYQHSSWMSAIRDRMAMGAHFLHSAGAHFVSIDEIELGNLLVLSNDVFGSENRVNLITVKTKVAGVSGSHHGKSLKNSTEYLLFNCKDRDEFQIIGDVYENTELMEFIDDMEAEGKSWKYTQALVSEGVKSEVTRFADGAGDEIILYRHDGAEFKPIKQIASEQFSGSMKSAYYASIDNIFDTTNAQSSIRQRVIDNSTDVDADLVSISYTPRSGRNKGRKTDLFYKGPQRRLFTWLRDTVEVGSDSIFKKTNSGNLWADIQSNNIAKEGGVSFSNGKKPLDLIVKAVQLAANSDDTAMDYFAGSGTTGHAVINLNREDGGSRKYILVEMGDYFDTVLKPRIQKVVYSKDWRDGKPVSREGSSHLVKVLRLESYEDALNNLEVRKPSTGQGALDFSGDDMKGFREDYLLHYMLDVETRGSASLLNLDGFRDPFAYELKIATSSAGETQPTKVDLIETFNYLLGLRVKTTETLQGFKVVTGTNPSGEKVLVIWRNLGEKDNGALDDFLARQKYNPRDMEFDLIYVNGDNNLQNLRREDETWKVRLIEEEFQRLMFDVRDV